MIKIAMVDDERDTLNYLKQKVSQISSELQIDVKIEEFQDGNLLLQKYQENEFHVVLLDLEMPEIDGLSLAKILRSYDSGFVLIFITNRSDLVFQSFEYDVTSFIRKNHMEEELKPALDRAYQKALSRMTSYIFKTEYGERIFPSSSIAYFLSKGHDVFLFDSLNHPTRILSTLEKIEDMLSPAAFVRCHSGIIVNCRHIFSINKTNIELTNKQVIPLSRYRVKNVKETFQRFLRSM